jgi:Galactose oxidase, central domain
VTSERCELMTGVRERHTKEIFVVRPAAGRFGLVITFAVLVSGAGLVLRAQVPPDVGAWASIGARPESRVGAAVVALPDGRTVIAGGLADGVPTDAVVIFDPANGSFTSVGQLMAPRIGHAAVLLDNGRILIAGGMVNDLPTPDIELFDLSSGASTHNATMTQSRSGHAAAALRDGTVLIVGGSGADGVLRSAEIFDPVSRTPSVTLFPLSVPRTGASATTLIDGRVLVAGGSNGTQRRQRRGCHRHRESAIRDHRIQPHRYFQRPGSDHCSELFRIRVWRRPE